MDPKDKRIKDGAKAIATDLAGPAGQIALDRVVVRHLDWFDLCQARGMSWPQISATLNAAGAGRENGLSFSNGHLSAVVWRQRQKAASRDADNGRGPAGQPDPPGHVLNDVVATDARSVAVARPEPSPAFIENGPTGSASLRRLSPPREDSNFVPVRTAALPDRPTTDSVRIRAAMNRAANLRRSAVDDS